MGPQGQISAQWRNDHTQHSTLGPKLTLQGHAVPADGHDGVADVLFVSIGAHMHLFKVHRHTRVPGAKQGQGSWPGPLHTSSKKPAWTHPDLALPDRRLGPLAATDGDLLELYNTVSRTGATFPSPGRPGGIASTDERPGLTALLPLVH